MVAHDRKTTLRHRLESAAGDLVYSSEGDHPFRFVELDVDVTQWPPTLVEFAAIVGSPGAMVEETDIHQLLARHVERVDPLDTEAQALRGRYDALRQVLRAELQDLRVFRVGRVQVRCFAVGVDPASRRVAGLETLAIET